MKFNSIRFELGVFHTLILGVIVVVFSSVLYFISHSSFLQIDKQLKVKARAVDETINIYMNMLGEDPGALMKAAQKTLAMKNESIFSLRLRKTSDDWVKQSQSLNLNKDYINFFSRDGKQIISSDNMNKELSSLFIADGHLSKGIKAKYITLNYKNKNIRLITYPLAGIPDGEYFIQVGTSQEPIVQQLKNWLYATIIVMPLVLFLMNYFARKQVARILGPVHEITQMANKITHQDLSARIKDKNFESEMGSLIGSFNEMIARLERSFKHIEEFSHHVAHELKTPLTIIKGEAELLLRKERSKQEYQQALRIVIEESDRVLKTIEDLLLMAKLDYQPEAFNFETFSFKEFFFEICEQLQILTTPKGIEVVTYAQHLSPSIMVNADRLHLRRLFFNIIDNAIKFSPRGGRLEISIDMQKDRVITSIVDSGPGISAEDQSRIFEKFFRTNNDVAGNGLGLSIAGAIAKIHHGQIQVESLIGQGSTFKIILPCTGNLS